MVRHRPRFLPLCLGLGAVALPACSGEQTRGDRAAWLQQALVDENLVWLNRDPELVADKYARMAADPYDFMRGTAGVFLRDLARPGSDRTETRFLHSRHAAEVLLLGDPHPENIGTTRRSSETRTLHLEVVDLDGAAFGPWILDLRRAAVGLGELGRAQEGCGEDCQEGAIALLARGYLEGLSGPDEVDPADVDTGPVVASRLREAREEGEERVRLKASTNKDDGVRHMDFDKALDVWGAGILPLDAEDTARLERLVTAYAQSPQAPPGFRFLDAGRRYGSGIASLPAPRFLLLYDRGGEDDDDDAMIELREIRDPTLTPLLVNPTPGLWEDNGDRLTWTAARVWSHPAADPRYAGPCDGELCFRVATWSSWFQEFDHTEEWEVEPGDEAAALAGLALSMGRIIGRAHAQGGTLEGLDSQAVILEDIAAGGGDEALSTELALHRAADLAQLDLDYPLFQELLDAEGPFLGAEDFVQWTP